MDFFLKEDRIAMMTPRFRAIRACRVLRFKSMDVNQKL